MICLSIFSVFFILIFQETPYKIQVASIYIFLLVFVLAITHIRKKGLLGKWNNFLLAIYPAAFFFIIFESFFMMLPYFNEMRYDQLMVEIDHFLLGVNPTVFIEGIISPLMTDIMYVFYFFYFPMPFILIIWLYKKGKFAEIEKSIFTLLLCYYGAYVTYFFVPVEGPRFYIAHLQTAPLEGIIFTDPIRNLIDVFEPNKLDCFPSLHTAILVVVMFLCAKYNRKLYYIYLPASVLILVSLIYCRYHYFIDMAVGFVWALICCYSVFPFYEKTSRFFSQHFSGDKN